MYLDLLPQEVLDQVVIPMAGTILSCQTCCRQLQLDSLYHHDHDNKASLEKNSRECNTNDSLSLLSLLSSYLSTSTTDVTGQSNSSLAARACYVKGKLKGTSMEDSIKHKVHFVKSFDELLQLDHADDIYCRSCALEYCWEADWDNRVLQMTKSQQEEERERQEWREDNLKVQQQKEQRLRQRHDITSASTATRKYKQGSSNSNNNNKQLM